MSDYLETLDLSQDERAKLRALGAKTPLALLAMRRASEEAFDQHLGSGRAALIVEQLESLLSTEEVKSLDQQPAARHGLGARLSAPEWKDDPS